MSAAVPRRRGRWGAAFALSAAVLFLSVVDAFPLVVLPLAILLVALRTGRPRSLAFGSAVLLWVFLILPGGDAHRLLSEGWALLVGGVFALTAVLWPRWSIFSRAVLSVASVIAGVGAWLWGIDAWGTVDWMMVERFRGATLHSTGEILARVPDAPWVADFLEATRRVAEWQGVVFPALLALQTIAALVLTWWAFARLSARRGPWRVLRPLRDFRFNDQFVWLAIGGLLLLLLPLGAAATWAGINVLTFMAGLYALRGLAVFVFLAGGTASPLSVALAALMAALLYPLALTAALLVGLGDTWLDVRRRAVTSPRT